MESKPQIPSKGMHSDSPATLQPEGTYRYAYNAVSESAEGDLYYTSTELSNEQAALLPDGKVVVGSVNISDNRICVFLRTPNAATESGASEIGILSDDTYTTFVNDATINGEFSFGIYSGVRATYRLVRGCEDRVYFTTPTPMVVDLSGNTDYNDISDFFLFKSPQTLPNFTTLEALETGNLAPGSYNIAVQLLDEDFNPTEWLRVSHVINIYNDTFSINYGSIRGSSSDTTDYRNYSDTNKSIRVELDSLDTNYDFYRLALIQASENTGNVTRVTQTSPIPLDSPEFTFTGNEAESGITVEEIRTFNNLILDATYIDQIENKLILGNTTNADINFCGLQRYASRITTDALVKSVDASNLVIDNSKWSTLHYSSSQEDGTGYMPGELYSFGIVYLLRHIPTGTVLSSPAYHIPGKAASQADVVFDRRAGESDIYPMSIVDNQSSGIYTDTNTCEGYWGCDSSGSDLKGEKVRHHRFPLRNDHGIPFFTKEEGGTSSATSYRLKVQIGGTPAITADDSQLYLNIEYTQSGVTKNFLIQIDLASYNPANGLTLRDNASAGTISNTGQYTEYYLSAGAQVDNTGAFTMGGSVGVPSGLTYTITVETLSSTVSVDQYTTYPMGIRFSNIEKPTIFNSNYEVIGYDILRHKREDSDSSVIDSAVAFPLHKNTQESATFQSAGTIFSDFDTPDEQLVDDAVGFISPVHKFFKENNRSITTATKQGEYNPDNKTYSSFITEDVGAGTSYDPEIHKRREADNDGFDLHLMTRETEVNYNVLGGDTPTSGLFGSPTRVEYLSALEQMEYQNSDGDDKTIYNTNSDNEVGIMTFQDKYDPTNNLYNRLNYVYLTRTVDNPYSNFRLRPYYKETQNAVLFDTSGTVSSVDVFHGDVYITPMRHFSSQYHNFKIKKRKTKSGIFNVILGVLVTAAGILLAPVTGGASLVGSAAVLSTTAAAIAVGFGLAQIASGIRKENISRVYNELYEAGLRDIAKDNISDIFFDESFKDDQIQFQGEAVTNIWFESRVNMALRQGNTGVVSDFLNAPANARTSNGILSSKQALVTFGGAPSGVFTSTSTFIDDLANGLLDDFNEDLELGELDRYFLNKVTTIDFDNQSGYLYKGYADAEIYDINKDYLRRNYEKEYYSIPLEYDCCQTCNESFPHRVHYSETSFSEELSDNYRIFLPNNFTDIPGETGQITGLFKRNNVLYVHTEEALWSMRQNIQERITDDVVSFIGTGEFLSLPPVKVVDDDDASAGTSNDWATINTRNGVFFISEKDRKVYRFDKKLEAISDNGEFSRSQKELKLNAKEGLTIHPDSLHNPFNAPFYDAYGFIAVYDYRLERYIYTKRDAIYSTVSNLQTYVDRNSVRVFPNFLEDLGTYQSQGYTFKGLRDGNMVFVRESQSSKSLTVTFYNNGAYTPQTSTVPTCDLEELFVPGEAPNFTDFCNDQHTKSYSMKDKLWASYHSYIPNYYLRVGTNFWSTVSTSQYVWKHNSQGSYNRFYGILAPTIIDVSLIAQGSQQATWESIKWQTWAKSWDPNTESFSHNRDVTFDQLIAYNNRQSTGLCDLKQKILNIDYISQQIINNNDTVHLVDRAESDFSLNSLRDMVTEPTETLFLRGCTATGNLDKVINPAAFDGDKDWTDMELLRDRFLQVRFIFNNFENVKLVCNYHYFNTLRSLR